MLENVHHVHFIGIGGAGMSPLARILRAMGFQVSGSDLAASQTTQALAKEGITVFQGHDPAHVSGSELVVISTAITPENVELAAARQAGLPVLHRSELLAMLLNERYGIAVAGAHGKTTITSMISLVLERAGLEPTIVIGGELSELGGSAKFGRGRYLVAEADESDRSFLRYRPVIAVVTGIEPDHLEYYESNFEKLVETFAEFLEHIRANGLAVLGVDNPEARRLAGRCPRRYVTYALEAPADYKAHEIKIFPGGSRFRVSENGEDLGEVRLHVPGEHNIANALATIAVAREIGLDLREIAAHLAEFGGAKRRFQVIGEVGGVLVVDDYAHHPTEIKATLRAARGWGRRVIAVFQPHRYSRTYFLFDEFAAAFADADEVILADIYSPPPDHPIAGVSSQKLARKIAASGGKSVKYLATKEEILEYLGKRVAEGDLVLTMGAGDIWQVARDLVARLAEREGTAGARVQAAALAY